MEEGQGHQVEAAGGVLWRRAGTPARTGDREVEVAVVHRPKYDDWSLPKGKLNPGEHPLLGALREIEEETGSVCRPGRFLGETRYTKDGAPKRVRYWALEADGGAFTANREVDEIRWLPPSQARATLAADHDRPLLDEFMRDAGSTWPCLLLRHASAGSRATWQRPDAERPLDARGTAQAGALRGLLAAYGVQRVLSADVRRCVDTVAPYASAAGLTVEPEPLLSEDGHAARPDASRERFLDLLRQTATDRRPTVLCSQGGVVDDLLVHACRTLGRPAPGDPSAQKGGMWVLHLSRAEPGTPGRLVGVERFDPPA